MNRRGAGVAFCFISALLISIKYISAAIFGSGVKSWNSEIYSHMLGYIGNTLDILSIISLIIGFIYILVAEITEPKNKV